VGQEDDSDDHCDSQGSGYCSTCETGYVWDNSDYSRCVQPKRCADVKWNSCQSCPEELTFNLSRSDCEEPNTREDLNCFN
jgi:hypothetical protein